MQGLPTSLQEDPSARAGLTDDPPPLMAIHDLGARSIGTFPYGSLRIQVLDRCDQHFHQMDRGQTASSHNHHGRDRLRPKPYIRPGQGSGHNYHGQRLIVYSPQLHQVLRGLWDGDLFCFSNPPAEQQAS